MSGNEVTAFFLKWIPASKFCKLFLGEFFYILFKGQSATQVSENIFFKVKSLFKKADFWNYYYAKVCQWKRPLSQKLHFATFTLQEFNFLDQIYRLTSKTDNSLKVIVLKTSVKSLSLFWDRVHKCSTWHIPSNILVISTFAKMIGLWN